MDMVAKDNCCIVPSAIASGTALFAVQYGAKSESALSLFFVSAARIRQRFPVAKMLK